MICNIYIHILFEEKKLFLLYLAGNFYSIALYKILYVSQFKR